MMNKVVILLAGAAFTLSACGKKDDAGTATADNSLVVADNSMGNSGMATAAPAPTSSQGFANAAAASDRFEIESSRLAEAAASSAAVKTFAKNMISGHTASTAKLKSTVAALNPAITIDDTLNGEQQAALDSLKGQTGTAFDRAYAAAQVDAHQKTLDMLRTYGESGDNAALKTLANGMVPTVAAHLNMAKGLK